MKELSVWRQHLLVLAFAALAALLGLAWLWWSPQPGAERAAPAWHSSDPPGPAAHPVELRGTGSAEAEADTRPVATADVPADQGEPVQRVFLRGTVAVVGGEPDATFDPPLEVSASLASNSEDQDHGPRQALSLARAGSFALEVTALCERLLASSEAGQLEIQAQHRDLVRWTRRIQVRDAAALLAQRKDLDPVEIVLHRAGRVRGVVLDVDGAPLRGADVAIFGWRSGAPEPKPLDHVRTDKEGTFVLGSPSAGRHLVAAAPAAPAAQAPGSAGAPGHAFVDLSVGETAPDVIVRLLRGEELRGRVLVDERPSTRAQVSWSLVDSGLPLYVRGGAMALGVDEGFTFQEGEVRLSDGQAVADESGTFVIAGLASTDYQLRVEDVSHGLLHEESKRASALIASAPRSDVVFDLRLARLRVAVREGGTPARNAGVLVCALGRISPEEDLDLPADDARICWRSTFAEIDNDEGLFELLLSPGREYLVEVDQEGYEQHSQRVVAPGPGQRLEHAVELVPRAPKPRLVVHLESPDGDTPERAAFGFHRPDEPATSSTPSPLRSLGDDNGAFILEDLVPGRFRLHVRPGRAWDDPPGEWAEAEIDVDVPAQGEAAYVVEIRHGGRLRVDAVDEAGRSLRARCTIRGPDGHDVPAWFRCNDGEGNLVLSTTALLGLGPSDVEPVLLPGAYRLRFELAGYLPAERVIQLQARRMTSLRVELRK